jgi:hypothetical protein
VDRHWPNKLERYVAQARCVVMGYGLAGAHREELKHKTAAVAARGTAQLPPKWIRNEQDCPLCVRYSMEHQEKRGTAPMPSS